MNDVTIGVVVRRTSKDGVEHTVRDWGHAPTKSDLPAWFPDAQPGDIASAMNEEATPYSQHYAVDEDGTWQAPTGGDTGPQAYLDLINPSTGLPVRISVAGLGSPSVIITDSATESYSVTDFGGITPAYVSEEMEVNGNGQFHVGAGGSQNNGSGFLSQETIAHPGEFFVIEDIFGDAWNYADRQMFGLVRETIVDGTDLDGGNTVWVGGGGQSFGPSLYFVGTGEIPGATSPYFWTTYTPSIQSPGGLGTAATGTFGGQTDQHDYFNACKSLGLGSKIRVGIAKADSDQNQGSNYANRLVVQLYVHQEIINDETHLNTLPGAVAGYGAGWYTAWATNGDYEDMGQNADGTADRGYHFKWAGTSGTTCNQLPYMTGVTNLDQRVTTMGQQHYVVYGAVPDEVESADQVFAAAILPSDHFMHPDTAVYVMRYQQPYEFSINATVIPVSYSTAMTVTKSPVFTDYSDENLDDKKILMHHFVKARRDACLNIYAKAVSHYIDADLDVNDEAQVFVLLADIRALLNDGLLRLSWKWLTEFISPNYEIIPPGLIDEMVNDAALALNTYVR